jgi:serine protease
LLLVAACADGPDSGAPTAPVGPGSTPATAITAPSGAPFVPGEVIVKLASPIDGTAPVTVAGQRLRPIRELPSGAWLMEVVDAHRRAAGTDALEAATLDALEALTADPAVEFAHENALLEFSLTPNDPLFAQQWHWTPTRVPLAWDRTTGSSAVRIAVIDSGRRPHPDLDGRWDPGYDFVDFDGDPTDPVDPYIPGVSADWPHGMHVAGIAGARSNNGTGGAGICWNCRLIPLRVQPTIAQIEQAVAWAAGPDGQPRRADVINMSFNANGTASNFPTCDMYPGVRDAIVRAAGRGVSVVASAGNTGFTNGARFPANCPNTIGVAASDHVNGLAAYSNRGAFTDVTAPGGGFDVAGGHYGAGIGCATDPNPNDPYAGSVQVLSTWSVGTAPCYRYLSGTSMSAPHVAGIVGLMRSVNASLTPAQLEQYVIATANAAILSCPGGGCGAGMVDARAAVDAALFGIGPEIEVTPTAVNFGNQAVGTAATPRAVTISNTGAGTLTFTISGGNATFPVDCGGPCSASLAPSQSRVFTVGFAPSTLGTLTGSVTVTSNDADEPTTVVSLSGTGVTPPAPVITVTPASLSFGNVPVSSGSAAANVTVGNTGSAQLNAIAALSNPDFFLDCNGPCSFVLLPGQLRTLTVTFDPTAAGARTGTLFINSNDPIRPTTLVALAGTGTAPGIAVSPSNLWFGSALVGTPTTMNVNVTNPGNAALVLSSASVPAGFSTPGGYPVVVAPGASRTIAVTCTRASIGYFSGNLVLSHNAGAAATVSLSCSSAGGRLVYDVPASGEIWLTAWESATVRARNTGPGSLIIEGLGFSGEPSSWFVVSDISLPVVLGAGQSVEWQVTCQPPVRTGQTSEKHSAKHDGIDPGSIQVNCSTGPVIGPPWFPIDPAPALE